ncbi:MAG: hypothetical protein AB2L21_05810 [Anaerolineaceae bacterium]
MKDNNAHDTINLPELEAVKLTWEDLSLTPPRFAMNGHKPKMGAGWTWGFLQEDPGKPCLEYLREYTSEKITMNYGIIQMADTPTGKQTGLEHCLEMWPGNYTDGCYANPGIGFPEIKYETIQGDPEGLTEDPFTYQQSARNPKLLYRFSSKYARVVEADFMDLTFEYMPYAMVMNANGPYGNPYIHQHAVITGTYEGRKVKFLGAWDRMYSLDFDDAVEGGLFTGISFSGIRSNGIREWGMVGIVGERRYGYYCKDGEEPVISTEVKFDANWIRLPYADDGTMLYTDATFGFADKTIHYKAKWGGRGQNYKIDMTRPGFSQTSGEWYEGSQPYKFETSMSMNENHNAFEKDLINR